MMAYYVPMEVLTYVYNAGQTGWWRALFQFYFSLQWCLLFYIPLVASYNTYGLRWVVDLIYEISN